MGDAVDPWGKSAQLRYWRANLHVCSSLKKSRCFSLPYFKSSKELPLRIACMVNASLSSPISDFEEQRPLEATSIRRRRQRSVNILQICDSNRDLMVQFMNKIRPKRLEERDEIESPCTNEQQTEPCSICLDPLNAADKTTPIEALSCGHIFHSNCVRTWLKYKNNCPIDRMVC